MATCNPEYTDTLVCTQFCHCQVSSYNMFLETGRLEFSRSDQHCGLLLDNSCQDNGAALLMQVQDHWWSNPDSKHIGSTPRHACSNPELHPPCTQCPLCRIVILRGAVVGAKCKAQCAFVHTTANEDPLLHSHWRLLELSIQERTLLSAEASESKCSTDY